MIGITKGLLEYMKLLAFEIFDLQLDFTVVAVTEISQHVKQGFAKIKEIQIEVPKNVEKELKEWTLERERAKKAYEKYVR